MRIVLSVFVTLCLGLALAWAQESSEAEKSRFTRYVQEQLSTENRQIRLNNIQGALSSEAVIGQITISDQEGVWLTITNARIDWNRSALLRRRLEIETLAADSIEMPRRPVPVEGAAALETSAFKLPELPVAIELNNLEVPSVIFGEDVFGAAAEISVEGGFVLADGALESDLNIVRLDGPGGSLSLRTAYANETGIFDLGLELDEPEDGIVANLLNIDGRPPIHLELKGSGPVDDLNVDLTLDADEERVFAGEANLNRTAEGLDINADLGGPIAQLFPQQFRSFFGDDTRLALNALYGDDGSVRVESLDIESGELSVAASAATTPDGFLRQLDLTASVESATGERVVLPVPGGETSLASARMAIQFGQDQSEEWTADLDVTALSTSTLDAESFKLSARGTAQNLETPGQRSITYSIDGALAGIVARTAAVDDALGDSVILDAKGAWRSGTPVTIEAASLEANGLELALAGAISELVYTGDIKVSAASIAPFSELAGRTLRGSLELAADGTVGLVNRAFALNLDGSGRGLQVDQAAADRLLRGETTISGRLERGEDGLKADAFRLENPQFELALDGVYGAEEADIAFTARLEDLSVVSPKASGALTVNGRAAGTQGTINVFLDAAIPEGQLLDRPLRDASIVFNGVRNENGLTGRLASSGTLSGAPLRLNGDLALLDEGRSLSNLQFIAGETELTGTVAQNATGLLEGNLDLRSSDISVAAALALYEAQGAVDAAIVLAHQDGKQSVNVDGSVRNLSVAGNRIAQAEFKANVEDLFGVPMADGTLNANDVTAGGIAIDRLNLNADRQGESTAFEADAVLENGTVTRLAGTLAPLEPGFKLSLTEAELEKDGVEARLEQPASIAIAGERIELEPLRLTIGEGSLTASGIIEEQIDVDVELRSIPLDIANAVRPDLQLAGVVSGSADISGTRDAPSVSFDLDADRFSAAILAENGVPPLSLQATGRGNADRIDLDASLTGPGGIDARIDGNVVLAGERSVDLDLDLASLPLALANGFVKGQDISGTLSGTASINGPFDAIAADFDIAAAQISATALRDLGVSVVDARAEGEFRNQNLLLRSAKVTGPDGLDIDVTGEVAVDDKTLDLDATLNQVPLALANRFVAGQSLGGIVSGTAQVDGPWTNPDARFDLAASRLSANALGAAGIDALDINVSGSLQDRILTFDNTAISGPQGLDADVSGTIDLQARILDLDVDINAAPIGLANNLVAGQNLGGILSGTAQVTGALNNPDARFDLVAAGFSAKALEGAGIGTVSVSASGALSDRVIRLDNASADGSNGLSVTASGQIPISGQGLNLAVNGTAPLSLGDRFLAKRGGRLGGEIIIDANVTGSLADPNVTGSISTASAAFTDPRSNLRLDGIALNARLAGDRIVIDSLSARSADGGTIAVDGSIGIPPQAGLPVDLRISLNGLRYQDGQLVAATVSGNLTLTGQLLRDPLLAGSISVEEAEITVPERFGSGAVDIAVRHVAPPADVVATIRKAERTVDGSVPLPSARPSQLRLNIVVDAPNRVFVRGRGLDAELGGRVTITGPVSNIQPVGALELIRGRLEILGQRIVLDEGRVTLTGQLDPFINFLARTEGDDFTVFIRLRGRVSDLSVELSSEPELPEDEVLARLIFGRSLSDLSPFQVLQLASAAAELAGGSNTSLVDGLRGATGLDDLDVVTDSEGNVAVRAGQYINDNVYLGVEAGERSRVTIDLDITEDLKARGAVGSDGDTSIGLFYEKDY